MEKAFDYLSLHPVMFIIAVIISIMILFSFLRRVVHLFLVAAALMVLYAAYLHFTGGNMHEALQHIGSLFTKVFHYIISIFQFFFDLLKSSKKGAL